MKAHCVHMSEHMGWNVRVNAGYLLCRGGGEGKEETEQHFHKTFGRMDGIIQTVAQLINQSSFFAGEMKVDKLAHLSIHFGKKKCNQLLWKKTATMFGFSSHQEFTQSISDNSKGKKKGGKKKHTMHSLR